MHIKINVKWVTNLNAKPKRMTSGKTKEHPPQKKNKNSCDLGYTKIS